ncbi:uncharacterized protein LOC127702733 [Mytilus californianus]|uniref:uncharacterized protein LOC127702733 n=1 Tax=Mytilus californianus TaxID=6549 RepID=UPI0022459878|nr:uncharacterized protein LOC127702733 [Mytilus californianus]
MGCIFSGRVEPAAVQKSCEDILDDDINDEIFRENKIKSAEEISNGKTTSQLKEPDAFRDVQKRETGVIVYQNTTDKEQWDFSDIDRYALQATYHTEMSVETLANQLSNPVQNTLETVRAIYVWITNNIRYDTDELKGDNKRLSDPQVVLKRRTCVCTGYAKLFEALCRSEPVKKFSKTDEYNCKIIEPVYRQIPTCTKIRFRMKCNRNLEICFRTEQKYTIKSDGADEDISFPKNDGLWEFLSDANNYGFQNTGYYKLTIFSETDSKNHKTGTFLIDCTEPANPCLPFPTTFAETHEYNCVLIEPLDGILPANSSITCRFRSSIILSAIVNGHMMTKAGSEWIITTTTPSTGEAFDIAGNQ